MIDPAALDADYREHVAALSSDYSNALENSGFDAVILHGGTARKRSDFDDQYWPIRPVPHFQHWVPLCEPDAAVVVRAGARPTLVRTRSTNFWEHPFEPESRHFEGRFEHLSLGRWDELRERLPRGRVAFVGDDLAAAAALGVEPDRVNPAGLLKALDALRTRKTAYEQRCLAEANRRAAAGHEAVRRAFADGADSELALHLAYLRATEQDDPETPYKNIVALGPHAATLHHVSYARGVRGGPRSESLLLDAGATCLGYCSDITRTWVRDAGDAAASAFAGLVTGLEAAQQRLCSAVRVGDGYESLHDRAHRELGELLARVGVVRCGGDEAVATGITRAFLPHGLGHSLGLQCHDVGCAELRPRPDNPFLRNTSVIAPRQVFTVEPGVYFIDALLRPLREGGDAAKVDWALVDALSPYGGVRIEDDLVVTDDPAGPVRNLTREHLPVGGAAV